MVLGQMAVGVVVQTQEADISKGTRMEMVDMAMEKVTVVAIAQIRTAAATRPRHLFPVATLMAGLWKNDILLGGEMTGRDLIPAFHPDLHLQPTTMDLEVVVHEIWTV